MKYSKGGNVKDSKNLENLYAENAKMKDMLSYVAIMSDIDIPEEEDENVQVVEEDA